MFGSNLSDYVLKSELATCCNGIGSVYLAKHRPSNEFIAVKKFKMDRAKLEENILIRVSGKSKFWHNILRLVDADVNRFIYFFRMKF